MTATGGIDAKADISANMKIYFLCLFSPIPLSLPPSSCCSSSLICEGVLTSPAAKVWSTGWLGDLKALLGMLRPCVHVYVCVSSVFVCTYCLRGFFRLGEGCVSDKGSWLSWPDPHRAFTSCQSCGLWRGGPSICTAPARAHPAGG